MRYAGERVRQTGLYRVTHHGHRTAHQAILWEGESFPGCRHCGHAVTYEFVRPAPDGEEYEHLGYDGDFMDAVLADSSGSCSQLSA